jgi:hypothetical protein
MFSDINICIYIERITIDYISFPRMAIEKNEKLPCVWNLEERNVMQKRNFMHSYISCRRQSQRDTIGLSVGDWPRIAQVMQADELIKKRMKERSPARSITLPDMAISK